MGRLTIIGRILRASGSLQVREMPGGMEYRYRKWHPLTWIIHAPFFVIAIPASMFTERTLFQLWMEVLNSIDGVWDIDRKWKEAFRSYRDERLDGD